MEFMYIFSLLFLLFRGSGGTDCSSDKITVAVDQIKNGATGESLSSTWSDGDTYTVVCKYPSTQVFTNEVRGVADVNQNKIDEFDDDEGSQVGEIKVSCDSGDFSPDIFSSVSSWCAVGCSPIPEDTNQYWEATYTADSLSLDESDAPIISNIDTYISVKCRDGYAPEMYQLGSFSTRCLSSGYSPSLSNMVQCTAGCTDISSEVSNARVDAERSAVSGAPPYNIGSVATILCSKGYTIEGSRQVTCNSMQRWNPDVPVCVRGSSQTLYGNISIVLVNVVALFWCGK